MHLTNFTRLALRVLVYLTLHPVRLCSIAEIALSYGVSRNQLMKVVSFLAREELVETVRGRSGGIKLAKRPTAITIGDVVRRSERLPAWREATRLPQASLQSAIFHEAYAAMFDAFDASRISDVAELSWHWFRLPDRFHQQLV